MPLMLLFPVDRDTHEIFCRLQSNVDAASLFQTNHVVHWNAPREDIFFPCGEENPPATTVLFVMSAIQLSAWPLFISSRYNIKINEK